jgi:hypothetical protein
VAVVSIDHSDSVGYPAAPTRVKKTGTHPRNSRRPLWLRALCPRPNGHVYRMVQARKVKRQPGVLR